MFSNALLFDGGDDNDAIMCSVMTHEVLKEARGKVRVVCLPIQPTRGSVVNVRYAVDDELCHFVSRMDGWRAGRINMIDSYLGLL